MLLRVRCHATRRSPATMRYYARDWCAMLIDACLRDIDAAAPRQRRYYIYAWCHMLTLFAITLSLIDAIIFDYFLMPMPPCYARLLFLLFWHFFFLLLLLSFVIIISTFYFTFSLLLFFHIDIISPLYFIIDISFFDYAFDYFIDYWLFRLLFRYFHFFNNIDISLLIIITYY